MLIGDSTQLAPFRGAALVPTMGALHEGHASLIRRARAEADERGGVRGRGRVLVTIFVNPTQFGPGEDFSRYPRTLDADLALCRIAGADAAFVPSVEEIYPRGLDAARAEAESFDLPPAATEPGLEDRCRPGHFGGVCLVVARLFQLCRPRVAYFGEKDWQQLRVISQMVERERLRAPSSRRFDDLEIVPCPTVREPDGLALSSRNRYLDADGRRRATALWRAILTARSSAGVGVGRSVGPQELRGAEAAMGQLLAHEGFQADYAVIREGRSLRPPGPGDGPEVLRMLLAARLGGVRLIDNAPLLP